MTALLTIICAIQSILLAGCGALLLGGRGKKRVKLLTGRGSSSILPDRAFGYDFHDEAFLKELKSFILFQGGKRYLNTNQRNVKAIMFWLTDLGIMKPEGSPSSDFSFRLGKAKLKRLDKILLEIDNRLEEKKILRNSGLDEFDNRLAKGGANSNVHTKAP